MSASGSTINLLDYQEVLDQIKVHENHLLLGNGFNRGLGVNTSYSRIFQKMTERDFGLYKEAESLVKECGEDLERFIGRLTDDIDSQNHFLKKFVSNKIKMDFMKATHEIEKNPYLTKSLNKLNTLSGIMVIIGASLDDNDDHIFNEINKSKVETLYISTLPKDKEQTIKKAVRKFPSKSIYLFDATSISYKLPIVVDGDASLVEVGK